MKITGKEEALKQIEKAMNLIREADKILFSIPNNIGLEIKDETEEKKAIPSVETDGIERNYLDLAKSTIASRNAESV